MRARALLVTRLPAPSIDDEIARHAVKKAPPLLLLVGRRSGAQQAQEGLLHDVIGVRGVAGHTIHVGPQRPRMARVERGERRFLGLSHPYATSAGLVSSTGLFSSPIRLDIR